jgi:DNA-binding GntR family transcriptional regulator
MILSGEVPSGAKLSEEALALRCGVSRTPVREALRRLEAELLISRSETLRSFVADWSLEDVEDAFALRDILESQAARRAAQRISKEQLRELKATNQRLLDAVSQQEPDVGGFIEHNRQFHATMLEAASSARLTSVLATVIEQPVVWRTAQNYGRENLMRSYHEHEELLTALSRKDGDWAAAVISAHVRRAFHTYADAHASEAHGMQDDEKSAA